MEDYMYIILLISMLITLGAQGYIKTTYNRYSKSLSKIKQKGSEVARAILDKNGLTYVKVESTPGHLSDHYDPKTKTVRLSISNYETSSISAISVAAHECGHALQDKDNYYFMHIRASLVPIVQFSSYAGYFALILGFAFSALNLIWLGILAEVIILLFQIITLPVEFNASKRALEELKNNNILNEVEVHQGKKVLTSAALTYVASVATAILELLRLILIYGNRRD